MKQSYRLGSCITVISYYAVLFNVNHCTWFETFICCIHFSAAWLPLKKNASSQ